MAFMGILAVLGTLFFLVCAILLGSALTSALCGTALLITNKTIQRNTGQKRMIFFPIVFLVCGFTILASFILVIVFSATAL